MNSDSTHIPNNSNDVRIPERHSYTAEWRRTTGGRHFYDPQAEIADSRSEITIPELWQVVSRRKAIFISCIAAGLILSLVYSLVVPARYEAVGRLTVDFDSSRSIGSDVLAQATGIDASTKLQTQVNVLETDALAWDVISRLRLDQRPEAAVRKLVVGPPECLTPIGQPVSSVGLECRHKLIDEFHRRLRVQPISRTEIIEIRYRSKSRELAAAVVNMLADLYSERSFQTRYQAAMRAATWLSGQLDEVKREAEAAGGRYIAFQKQTGVIGTDENHNILIERLVAINQQLVLAESERIVREARNRIAQEGDPETIATVVPGGTLQVLHGEEARLRLEYAQLTAKFGENYPRVIQLKEQLQQAEHATQAELARTRQRVQSEYESARNSEALLRTEFERQKQEAYNLNVAAIQVALLKREVDASNELYEQLVRKLKEAGILAGISANSVTMIDPATVPVKRVEPATFRNLIAGLLAGIAFGLGLCFLVESLNTKIASLKDVAQFSPFPVLGLVPRIAMDRSRVRMAPTGTPPKIPIVTLDHPESEGADAYRSLRTSLRLSNPGAPPKVILITSSLPHEGKSTIAVNMAVVFAQKNCRVLLVDGDLRCGELGRYFQFSNLAGLSAVLAGEDPKQYYAVSSALPNLTVLPSGLRPPKPPDLLDSDRMRQLIASWRDEFDQILIDAPPIIGLSDGVILSTMVDTVIVVVRSGQCRRQDINVAAEILNGVDAPISGIVLNDVNPRGLGYYGDDPSLYGHYFHQPEKR